MKLTICMKSGVKYIVQNKFDSINDLVESIFPNGKYTMTWYLFKLEYLENGVDTIVINTMEIESINYDTNPNRKIR